MRVKLQVVGYKDHEKGAILLFRNVYNERVSTFVMLEDLPEVQRVYMKDSVHVLDVTPGLNNKTGSPTLDVRLDTKPKEIDFGQPVKAG